MVLIVSPVLAERLPLKLYTSADGLGSSFVDYLMRDSRGFMWFCTRDGLSRFDGARFVTYRVGDKDSAVGIEGIYQTRDGNYWVATTAGMFWIQADAVSQLPDEIGGRPFLHGELVGRGRGPLLEDRQGNLFYGSNDLYRITRSNGKFEFTPLKLDIVSALARRRYRLLRRCRPSASQSSSTALPNRDSPAVRSSNLTAATPAQT